MQENNHFNYFGFASNMKKTRMMNCKNPKFISIGKLKDYKLVFAGSANITWGGSMATITESPGETVWGAVWEVTSEDISNLDRQEGVHLGKFKRIELDIETDDGTIHCCAYKMCPPQCDVKGIPSHTYLNVIVAGAKEINLPSDYIAMLEGMEHNSQKAGDNDFNKLV